MVFVAFHIDINVNATNISGIYLIKATNLCVVTTQKINKIAQIFFPWLYDFFFANQGHSLNSKTQVEKSD